MRKAKYFIFLFLVCLLLPIRAEAKSNVTIIDDAYLLSDDEYDELEEYLDSLDSSYNYVVATTDESNYGQDEDSILFDFYTENYNSREDGVAFLIDMYHRELYLSGYGKAQYEIKNADAYDITDNVYRYASNGEYYECIYSVFEQCNTLINDGIILRPMRLIVTALVSIILGFLFVFLKAVRERARVQTFTPAEMLLIGASIAGTSTVLNTTRRRIASAGSTYHGGGGGFSGGGGGFSGGGGGGHSGGGHSF